jgi:hypothetical protein
MEMSFEKKSLGWMYYEMEYGYIFTGAYDPNYWGYSSCLSPGWYYPNGRVQGTDGALSKRSKSPL